ncbi:DUF4097 family beta strand repeat-containing protein [Neobacillus novalis]|uniref:DUF4097 family beta strand repeat-containing protein n=1 Tax=Neobacillus novalis TaxID=220687 RepID=A0AA95MQW7_9BACI|nr:DUF4097 family beta strand repeat-containing protein [Neobacillus novalis]WHY88657.1 DUF4097 family beta strand repeat-containing protein [Neobacillus novalis]
MKKFSIVAAILGLVIGVIGVVAYGYTHDNFSTVTIDETKTINAKDINKIELESRLSSVHFYPTNSDVITVHLHGETSKKNIVLSVSTSGETAKIDIEPKNDSLFQFSPFEFMTKQLQADVEIPQKMYSELKGHASAGSITIEQISANHFDLDSSAGSIKANDLKGDVTAHSSAGSMKLTNIEGKLDLTDSAGSIDVKLKAITHDIYASISAGSVRIVTEQQPESLQMDLRTSAGHVDVNLANVSYSTKERDRVIAFIGSGGPKLKLESSAGSVSINKK